MPSRPASLSTCCTVASLPHALFLPRGHAQVTILRTSLVHHPRQDPCCTILSTITLQARQDTPSTRRPPHLHHLKHSCDLPLSALLPLTPTPGSAYKPPLPNTLQQPPYAGRYRASYSWMPPIVDYVMAVTWGFLKARL